jgi:hypothetical protein
MKAQAPEGQTGSTEPRNRREEEQRRICRSPGACSGRRSWCCDCTCCRGLRANGHLALMYRSVYWLCPTGPLTLSYAIRCPMRGAEVRLARLQSRVRRP